MQSTDCRVREELAEDMASDGLNSEAMDLFLEAARCWEGWEEFGKAAASYERAYEHGMLAQRYAEAAQAMRKASRAWLRQGEHEKFEIDCQIAAEAYILVAENEQDPTQFVDGAFCAILGGDIDLARHLIHAAAETTSGHNKELINLALMLSEYQFGDADMYIRAAVARVTDKQGIREILELFELVFTGFVRTTLESELAISIKSLSESSGLPEDKVERLVRRGIERGYIPGVLDEDSKEIVVDPERTDVSILIHRKRPILSRDIEDPGAWDMEDEE